MLDNQHKFITKLCGHYSLHPIVIDKLGDWPEKKNVYHSIAAVLDDVRFKNTQFVWLDASGDQHLDEFEHPEDNVMYCVGADIEGFDGIHIDELPGVKIKLRQPLRQEGEWFASIIVPLVVYDRFLYVSGRRK